MKRIAFAAAVLCSAAVCFADYHVAPGGSDENPGTKDKPFATPERARDAVRALRKGGGLPEDGITVWIHGGVYVREKSFVLSARDSGKQGSPVVYAAAGDGEAIFAGGPAVAPAAVRKVTDDTIRSRLPAAVRGTVRVIDLKSLGLKNVAEAWPVKFRGYGGWPELFCAGKPLHLARWPNEGWARIQKVVDKGAVPRHGDKRDKPGRFVYDGDRPSRWAGPRQVYLNGYWHFKWYDECIRIGKIDPDKKIITLAAPHHYGLETKRKAGIYYALNVIEELDRPGEYVVDTERNRIFFIPPAGGGNLAVSATAAPLVELKEVSCVVLRGLTFSRLRGSSSAIVVNGGRNNRIVNCTVRNCAGSGITVDGGTGTGVVACHLSNLGRRGITLKGGSRATLRSCGHFARDNHIHHFARLVRTYQPAAALNGVGCILSHNLIHDAPHAAVLFGGNNHTIEFNHIRRVCMDTDDAGAIYNGRDWSQRGTVIRYNFIHDLGGGDHIGNQGVYLDDMLCGTTIYGNVFCRMGRAIMIGGGRDNVVKNNLVLDCRVSVHVDARGLGWAAYHARRPDGTLPTRLRRVPYQKEPWVDRYPKLVNILDEKPAAPAGNVVTGNVFWRCKKTELAKQAVKLGTIEGNVTTDADLRFADYGKLDLRLKKDSPVFEKLPGFKPIPFEKIGRGKNGGER